MNRINFTELTKKRLRMESGYLCANPSCRSITIYHKGCLGQACHIIAASSNGPRNYEEKYKVISDYLINEISSDSNGIWLCLKCAKQIDLHPKKYPIELLKKWKKNTIQFTENHVNIPLSYYINPINYYVLLFFIIMSMFNIYLFVIYYQKKEQKCIFL